MDAVDDARDDDVPRAPGDASPGEDVAGEATTASSDPTASSDAASSPPRPRREPGLTALTVVILAVPVLALLGLAVAFALDAMTLRTAASDLESHARAAQDALEARDSAALASEVESLQAAAHDFTGATDGPHWWIATHLIVARDQAIPLVAAGKAAGAIADGALAPLVAAGDLEALSTPTVEDGRVDPLVLEPYRPALAEASVTLAAQQEALAAVDVSGTVDLVKEPFEQLAAQLDQLAGTVEAAHVTAELLPTMLGAEGPRTYLVLVQNNAEPRATGGIAGAFIELTVDDGRLGTGAVVPGYTLEVPGGVAPLTDDERKIYSDRMAIYPQDVNFTPEFPRAAELATAFWVAGGVGSGAEVDGVLAVDPVALGWMLGDSTSVEVDGIELAGDTLAPTLMNRAYAEFDTPQAQDAFFARAASALFGELLAGTGSAVDGVTRAVESGRFLLWSSHADEQAMLVGQPIAGAFLERDDALGVFVNDGSGSKIGYYVDVDTVVTDRVCLDGSVASERVEVTLTHTYDGAVEDLPDYVGVGGGFVPAGQFQANVALYPGSGMRVAGATADGAAAASTVNLHDDRTLVTNRVTLDPGESTVLAYELEVRTPGQEPPDAVQTPGPRDGSVERVRVAAEGC